ncbi:hypothetical protein A3709_19155 [Halioglobus sp. HI00S01]|uniref:hypothetical protein n=1 Tax=Halioglobus sp. HI00S01 TaxID=1822214 RepID=UPI0007C3A08E|nr:hypothetical protein [Halioglobus sp. HI00S01]KZX57744.1 hypothetical protein A3709_19155 [Halioglobus sp. HI00S01]
MRQAETMVRTDFSLSSRDWVNYLAYHLVLSVAFAAAAGLCLELAIVEPWVVAFAVATVLMVLPNYMSYDYARRLRAKRSDYYRGIVSAAIKKASEAPPLECAIEQQRRERFLAEMRCWVEGPR